jgi:phospholipid/cholesterol/gamma-HCH transport system ATP-binding protein
MSLIELRHVSKRFGWLVVLDDVSLSIEAGKAIVIIGASGTGKSVLLKHIVGLLKPDKGEVWFDGQRIDELPERKLMDVRQRFGFLFQMGALFDSATVADNVGFPLVEHTHKAPEEIREIVQRKLALVGLPDVGKKMPAELSGGQKKRVALARAIALNPEVILYDEPTTGLDPIMSDVINELIMSTRRNHLVTSIVVTHDMRTARKVADRVVMLYPLSRLAADEPQVIYDGPPSDLDKSRDERVRQFVHGEAGQRLMELREARAAAAG